MFPVSSPIETDATPRQPFDINLADSNGQVLNHGSTDHEIEDRYPLSSLQQGMLYHAITEPNSGVDIEQMVITLHEWVAAERLISAWQRLVSKHPILRTSFQWEGLTGEPQQLVWAAVKVSFDHQDLTQQFPESQNAILKQWLLEDRRKGFVMDKPPLMRWTLFRLNEYCFKLVWTFHHALLDGRSFPLLLDEVFQTYDGFITYESAAPRPYREFIQWQRGLDLKAAENFWREKLKGFAAMNYLPIIDPQSNNLEKAQASAELSLSPHTTSQLASLASTHNITLNTLVQGAWAILLSRYSRDEDVIFGATRAGRHSTIAGAEQIPGLFINTVPVRAQVSADAQLIPWLQMLRQFWVDVRPHEHTPLSRVQAWSGMAQGTALFNTLLVFENYDLNATFKAKGGPWFNRDIQLHELTNFPICLAAYAGEQLRFVAEYDQNQVSEYSIRAALNHLCRLLENISLNPWSTIGQLSLLTIEERDHLLHGFATRAEVAHVSPSETIQQRFEQQVALRPEAIAASCDGVHLSYQQLNAKANQLANFLRAHGVKPDTLVGVCTERSLDLLVALLGILKAGAAYLPIDLAYPADRLAFMLEDAQAPFLLTQSHLLKDLPQHTAEVICLDDSTSPVWSSPAANPEPLANADHLAYVIYTSGSTGKPKGVQIPHRNVLRLFDATQNWFHFDEHDVWSLFHSYAFDFSVWEIWGALMFGGRVVVVPFAVSRSPHEFAKLVAEEKVTVLNQTPSAFKQFSAADEAAPQDLALRLIIFGGEALEMASLKPWFDRHGDAAPRLINMYGITETTVHVTYRPLSKDDLTRGSLIGVPIPDLQLYVLDANLEPAPIGVPGEMFVGGAGLAKGYLNRAELTAERFIAHPFSSDHTARLYRTGDLAKRLANGDIEYLGRIDQQVQLRGFRVELGEIESVLLTHPQVREAKVILREDTPGDQRLAAYLIPSNGVTPTVTELREHLQKKVPDYMVPAAFVTLKQFPLTNNGKLDTKALPQPTTDRAALASSYTAPQSDAEKTLAKIWQDVLKTDRVGATDNFFELGGDSIISIQIISRARAAGLDLMPKHLFKNQTIAELAAVCSSHVPMIKAAVEEAPSGNMPLTPIQRWFFEHDFADKNHWTQSFLFETTSAINADRLRSALKAVVNHHSALRLRFANGIQSVALTESGELLQVISGTQIDTLTPQTQLDIVNGPLLRAVLYPEANRFFLTIHHLAVDGVSWRILLEDLEAAYHGRNLASATASFGLWSKALSNYSKSPILVGEAAYWRSVLLSAPEEPALPYDAVPLGENIESSVDPLSFALSESETQTLLRDVPAAFGTRINAALLTALASAFKVQTGKQSLFLELEGHGREHVVGDLDTTRSVGWFTSIFPVSLSLPATDDLIASLKSVQKQLNAIPENGVGYGVLRHLGDSSFLGEQSYTPDLVFNHLGQFDQVTDGLELFRFATETLAPWHGGKNKRTHALEINTIVVGGKLEIRVASSRSLHQRETIVALAEGFVSKLRELITLAKSQANPSLPLSPMQQLFYTLGSSKPNYPYDQWHARLEGALNLPFFQQAWNQVVNRHSILRSTFTADGRQTVHAEVTPQWIIKDAAPEDIKALLDADKRERNDLSQPSLSRFNVLRFSASDHFFLWSLPDLQMDGWSWPVLFQEVSQIYSALVKGEQPMLPSAKPYSNYLDWLANHDDKASLAFWKSNLEGFKTPTALPLDIAATRSSTRRFIEQTLALNADDTSAFKSAVRHHRLTAGIIVQAAWAALLSKCAQTNDVVFGAAFSGRPADLPDVGSIVGPFTNNLPVRLRVDASSTAAEFLASVQDRIFDLDAHQFTSPLEIQEVSEVAWKDRLFNSIVVFQNYEVSDKATRLSDEVRIRDFVGPIHTNFDLTLVAVPGDELQFTLIHDESRCSQDRAAALLRDLSAVVTALAQKPDAKVGEIQALIATPSASAASVSSIQSVNYIAPNTELQRQIAAVWQKAFGLERIGIDDNFFDLGGHSLLLVRVHRKLREVLQRDFPVVTLFQHPTVSSLAKQFDASPTKIEQKANLAAQPQEGNQATTDIAIVGMAIRAPGADTLEQFWQNLVSSNETITTFSKNELTAGEPIDDSDYIPRRGILKGATFLDANFFGIKPKEAEVIDPQQRLFLEAAYEALETAGVYPREWDGVIGVYAGVGKNYYYLNNVHHNQDLRDLVGVEAVNEGAEKDYIAPRVAYKLDLTGPALNIHTACSTSLVAVCQAVRAIIDGDCDMAIAGGAAIRFPQERGYLYEEGSIQSRDGHCRAFDAASSGTVFSNGLGVVVLKRLDLAQRDGDTIYSVIKGVGLNNDGAGKVSFTAPSVDGQAGAIEKAFRMAGVSPDTISYVEAHGTGTPLGDPIEIAGLTKAYQTLGATRKGFCGIGSLKPSTGHLDAAAGVCGLIKATLALHHKLIPATLHFLKANPKLGLEASPFRVIDRLTEWKTQVGTPRRAGVSALGVGGTNAHVILEEAPLSSSPSSSRANQLLILSAKTETALENAKNNLAQFLETKPTTSLADTAFTLQIGRQPHAYRTAVTASSVEEAIASLRSKPYAQIQTARDLPVTMLFPGQGAQYPGMGEGLYATERVYKETVDHCAEVLMPVIGLDLRTLLYPSTDKRDEARELLKETRFTQPAIFITSYAMAQVWSSWGIRPSSMLGHSVGEYVAATLAGVFTLEETLVLVAKRAQLVQDLPGGAMLAVRLSEAEVVPLLPSDLDLAALNSKNLTVVAGSFEAIERFEQILKDRGITAKRLATSHAFHSRMMEPAIEPFKALFADIKLHAPSIPFVSNVTGRWVTEQETTDPAYWAAHIRQAVRFTDGLATLFAASASAVLEVGPGTSCATFARQHPAREKERVVVSTLNTPEANEQASALEALGKLWLGGVSIPWAQLYASNNETRRRIALPTYPFERQNYCAPAAMVTPLQRPFETVPAYTPEPAQVLTMIEEPVVATSRLETITNELKSQLHEISGMAASELDSSATFLDLGFDSLFLTQASLVFKKHFGVKITFRQLMEDLNSIGALAAHLDAALPADRFAPVPRATKAPEVTALTSAPVLVETSLEQRMAALEAAIGRLVNGTVASSPKQETVASSSVIKVQQQNANPNKKMAFGPFRQIEKTATGTLTSVQEAHLKKLIASYNRRTDGSKKHTQKYRRVLADPRAVAGFNPLWKDLIYPIVADRSEGSKIWDIDGNEYVDVTLGFGLSLFGHRPKFVQDAIKAQLDRGIEIGPSHPLAGEVAQMLLEFSGMERVSFCDTGSEAVTAAIRIARTVSGRDKIAMFTGAYHGIFDEVLVRPLVVNGELRSIPIAPGITSSAVQEIIVLEYGNPESLEIMRRHGHEIAAILIETVQSRRPDFQPVDFLKELRAITKETETALVFDEVVTGFRAAPGGNQERFGIRADIVTYGKVIGGGLPIGVVAGTKKYMDALDGGFWQYGDESFPEVGVTFFAGTFVRHPLALAAAKAVLTHLKREGSSLQQNLEARTVRLVNQLNAAADRAGVPIVVTRFSSLYFFNFAPELKHASLFFVHMRMRGIHIWESRPSFISTAHSDDDIETILRAFTETLRALQSGGFFPKSSDDTEPDTATSFPLTGPQEEVFLASHLSEGANLASNESVTIKLSGAIDLAKMKTAIQSLVDRHENLRTTFTADGTAQMVTPKLNIEVQIKTLAEADGESSRPFDLVKGPLFRATIIEISATEHHLILASHHSVCDGWSFDLLVSDLAALYNGSALSDATPFRVYAAEQQAFLASPEFAENEKYWVNQFATLPDPFELPTDFKRPAMKSYSSGTAYDALSPELSAQLRTFCKANGLTPYAVLLSAYHLVLAKLSGQSDIIIGAPIAGQAASGHANLCGHCVNFLPMRLSIADNATILDHLKHTRGLVLDTLEHQDYTLGHLTRQLQYGRDAARPQFVNVTFTLEPAGEPRMFGEASATAMIGRKTYFAFDLGLFVVDSPEAFKLHAIYSRDLLTDDTASRWLGHFKTLVEGLITTPASELVSKLPLLTKSERESLLTGFISSSELIKLPPSETIQQRFEQQVTLRLNAIAASCDGLHLSYQQLNAKANQLANFLRAHGVKPDTLVGVCTERSLDLLVALLGILKAGAAYLPIDLAYPADRLAFMLEDAQAPFLLTQSHLLKDLPQHTAEVICLDDSTSPVWSSPAANPEPLANADHLAYVIYTSGSTGKPKGVQIPHRNVLRLFDATQNWFHFDEHDVWSLFHSYAFDFSVWEIWGALMFGGRVVVVPFAVSRSPHEFAKLVAEEKVTVLNQTPSAFKQFSAADEAAPQDLALRLIIFGGEALEMASLKPWFDRHGDAAPRLINMYGITETTVHVTYRPLSKDDLTRGSLIGVPIPDLQLYVLDANLEPAPIGVPGEMFVGGAGLAKGYLNRAELTAERFIAHPFSSDHTARLYRTGDLAKRLANGDIEYLGRIDQQVQLRGFRVELGEIESVLLTHPQVREAKVILREDTPGDQRLAAYLIPSNGVTPTVTELREHLQKKVPDYMVPAAFVTLKQFPLTNNGKLDTKALPQPTTDRAALASSYTAPQSDAEKTLAKIWQDVLKTDRVGATDNFFELGGHSLLGLALFTRIQKELDVALPLATLFQAPTLGALAKIIESLRQPEIKVEPQLTPVLNEIASVSSILALVQSEGTKTPLFSIHGGDGGSLFYGQLATGLQHERRFYAIEAPSLMDRSEVLSDLSVEGCAERYLREIKKVQPVGPYLLGGYSFGGVVAWEMAQQLRHSDEEVLGVILFDTSNPRVEHRNRYSLAERISAYWRLNKDKPVLSRVGALAARFANGMISKRKHFAAVREAERALKNGLEVSNDIRLIQVREAHTQAFERYVPKPLNAPVILLRANTESDHCFYTEELGWEGLTPAGINVVPITGAHLDIFQAPNLTVMINQLNSVLHELP